MESVKWHMLDYLSDDIVRNGGLCLCDEGLYEYSHTIFKNSSAKNSNRKISIMYDSVAIVCCTLREDGRTTTRKRTKQNELEKPKKDSLRVLPLKYHKEYIACASRSQMTVTVAELKCTSDIEL